MQSGGESGRSDRTDESVLPRAFPSAPPPPSKSFVISTDRNTAKGDVVGVFKVDAVRVGGLATRAAAEVAIAQRRPAIVRAHAFDRERHAARGHAADARAVIGPVCNGNVDIVQDDVVDAVGNAADEAAVLRPRRDVVEEQVVECERS